MRVPARHATAVRAGLLVLAAGGVLVGAWAGLAPRSFYDDFPGLGATWVAVDGPYNEHLVQDVGWLNLALAAATIWAAVALTRALVVAVAVAWIVVGVPHLVYHAANLEPLDTGDRIAELGSLALGPVVAVVVLALARARGRAPGGEPAPGGDGS